MPILVVAGATLTCTGGTAPSTLAVPPVNKTMCGAPAATIEDSVPGKNIPPFAMCQSMSNPAVASATSAAMGVLTPQPCSPVVGPWAPGSATVMIGGKPALHNACTLNCYGQTISIANPGQAQTQVK